MQGCLVIGISRWLKDQLQLRVLDGGFWAQMFLMPPGFFTSQENAGCLQKMMLSTTVEKQSQSKRGSEIQDKRS